MASIFQNKFFSLAGQQERFANVGNTLLAAVGIKKGGVQSNTGNKTVDAALSAAASHPFITAGVAAVAVAPAAAGAAAKAGASAAGRSFASATLGQKAAVLVSAPIVAGAVASNPKLITKAGDAPGALVNFGANVGNLAENPSFENLKKTVKENPVVAGSVLTAGAIAAGVGIAGLASTAATYANTQAIKKNSEIANVYTEQVLSSGVLSAGSSPLYPQSVAGQSNLAAPVTDSAVKTPIIPAPKNASPRRKRKKKPPVQPKVSQSVRVYNIDDRDVSDRKVYKQVR